MHTGPIQGIPVTSIRKAEDPHKAPKLTIVRGLRGYEDEESNWAVDQVVKSLRRQISELEVADLYLPAFKILGGVSNDPENDLFSPEDQFPSLLDPLHNADIIIVATRERCGLPDANIVRVVERLVEKAKEKSKEHPGMRLFDKKAGAVVVSGSYGAYGAATLLSSILNKFGVTVARHGLAFWDHNRGKIYKSDEFAVTLDQLAVELHDLCKALRR